MSLRGKIDLKNQDASNITTGVFDSARIPNRVIVIKQADESVSNDSVLHNDNELFFNAEANKIYVGNFKLYHTKAALVGIKYKFTLPVGATMRRSNPVTEIKTSDFTAQQAIGGGDGTLQVTTDDVLTIMGSTAGLIRLQWAQNVSDPSTTTVNKGTSLILRS